MTRGGAKPLGLASIRHILVIKHGALGDIALAFGPFAAIRAYHPDARVTLLTTAPFAAWLGGAPWFDAVVVDARPRWWDLRGLARLTRQLRGFDLVYDLQTSGRSTRYFWLAACPAWSGTGWFRRYPHRDADRDRLHTWERQRGQLRDAGIAAVPPAAADGLRGPSAGGAPYAVLVPGAAAHRADKRWPAERFAALARILRARGLGVVVVGTDAERPLGAAVSGGDAAVRDLTGQTGLAQLSALLADAAVVIGNDTGPLHLAAALGAPCVVLFGPASDPALTAPRRPDGGAVTVLRAERLADLTVEQVAAALP